MSDTCGSCQQRPGGPPDDRCETCAAPSSPGGARTDAAPPHHTPYQGAPPPTSVRFVNPQGLANALTVLFGVMIGAQAVATVVDARMLAVLRDLEDRFFGYGSDEEYYDAISEYNDTGDVFMVVGLLQVLMVIGIGIVFIVWFHRTRVNAELFDPAGLRM